MGKPFQYGSRKRGGRIERGSYPAPRVDKAGDDLPEVMVVQGQVVDSKEEYRLAMAFEKYKVAYIYQYELLGGDVAGGIIVDFLVLNPWAWPVEVFGEYFHKPMADGKDELRLAILFDFFHIEPGVVWDYELETQEMADEWVKSHV